MEITHDDFVFSFLKAAHERKLAALVVYGFTDVDGKLVTRVHSNSAGAAAGMSMLTKMLAQADDTAFEVAAKAAYDKLRPLPMPWAALTPDTKQKFIEGVTVAFAAAQVHISGERSALVVS